MRLAILSAFASLVATAGFAQFAPPDASPSTPVDEVELLPFEPSREDAVLEGFVDGVVGAHRREHDAPAVSVSIVRDGRIVFAKAYGEADVESRKPANGADTLFRIGSVSKTFTWTAVMMLHDRGLIDLNADVNRYLKDVFIPEAFNTPVTMNHLMAHRAGFEDTFAVFTYADDGDVSLTDGLNETMPKRVYPPGARTSYSNWGAALAAKIVEDVSGVPYWTFVEQEILAPLAMTHTTIDGPSVMSEADRANLAIGYDVSGGAYAPADYLQIGPFAPAGAMASTANDMAQWMLVHLGRGEHNGARLMSAAAHELMWTRAFDDRAAGSDMAHGFITTVYRGIPTFGHGGATTAYYTDMTLVPELDLGIYVSQSTTNNRTLIYDLAELVIDHVLDRPATPAQNDPAFAELADTFAGEYLNNRRSFTLFEKLFATTDIAVVAAAEGGALSVTIGGKTKHYAPLPGAADTFEERDGDRIVFGRDENGHITHFSDGSGVHSHDRIGVSTNPALVNMAIIITVFFAATTVLGAWRRQGREVAQTPLGAMLGLGALAAALFVFVFAGAVGWVIRDLSSLGAAAMQAYPPTSVQALRLAGLAIFAANLAALVSYWPVWRGSGWSVWRKLHHTLFALALAALSATLIFWNVIFSATA